MKLKPTDEQVHILDRIRSSDQNLIINALAGTGKTSTLRMIDNEIAGRKGILYLAFNKRIVDEANEPEDDGTSKFNTTTIIRTLNGQGHRIWAENSAKRLVIDKEKTKNILRSIISTFTKDEAAELWDDYTVLSDAYRRAKALGYIPTGKFQGARRLVEADKFFTQLEEAPSELVMEATDRALIESIKQAFAGNIDFDDQLYMPALFGHTFPKFDIVLIDEAQDLSSINHALLKRLAKNSRLIAVGDPWQSIYAFRGAVQDGMRQMKQDFQMEEADLSISFRCPRKIVEAAQWRVPHLKWSREGGNAAKLLNPNLRSIPDDAAIICRNNAPLFKLALHLLATKRSVSVVGSEVGPKIIKIMAKLGDESMSKERLGDEIENWRQDKLAKQSTTANDVADCMHVFAGFGETLGQALGYADFLFKQQGSIQLLTGHKAKGLEWNTVYHMDSYLCQDHEQDKNLRYVITTRSKDQLLEFDTKDLKW